MWFRKISPLVLTCFIIGTLFTSCQNGNGGADSQTTEPDDSASQTEEVTTQVKEEPKDPRMLYNGIYLPELWPPKIIDKNSSKKVEIPYLAEISQGGSHPEVVNITVGRQLFVDDFLISSTNLKTTYHAAVKYEGNPVVDEKESYEKAGMLLRSGGVWFDKDDKKFKMWYTVAQHNGLGYAESTDGINWTRPQKTLVFDALRPDSTTVWIDYDAPKNEKYKLFIRSGDKQYQKEGRLHPGYLYYSSDGINWKYVATSGDVGDRTCVFYNPFRDIWSFSIRDYITIGSNPWVRARSYSEGTTLKEAVQNNNKVFWQRVDDLDPTTKMMPVSQMYAFDAVGYESIMLGLYTIITGPDNTLSEQLGMPKGTHLMLAYSRDGFYFDRPDRSYFIESTMKDGTWDQGYVIAAGGVCIIVDDELWFYYSAYQAVGSNAYGKTAIGLAKLRRDGFVSLDGTGEVLTRKMTADGKKHLFVNVDAPAGSIAAEIIDSSGNPVKGYTIDDCIPVTGDTTSAMIKWKSGSDLSFLNGKEYQIRFKTTDSKFYAFWLSADESGDSGGYDAAGYKEIK